MTAQANNSALEALADIDEALAFEPEHGGTAGVAEVCARFRACVDHRAPHGSIYRKMAEEVRPATDGMYNHEDVRLRAVLTALRHDMASGNIVTPVTPNEAAWLSSIEEVPSRQLSDDELLRFIEHGFELSREAHVLALIARDASTSRWKPVFGRIDLVRRGDPPTNPIHPRGNVRVIEERPSAKVLLDRIAVALKGEDFVIGDVVLAEHGMNNPWMAERRHENGLDYGTDWPSLLVAPLTAIKNRPHIDGAIEADGPVPVFMGLERLAWAVSRFRQSPGPGLDVRPRRFQLLAWDYRGRIDRFRSTGKKLLVSVTPAGDPSLRLVAVAQGRVSEVPFLKDAPGKEELVLDEQIIRARVTLRQGDDVIVEHALDLPREHAFTQLQGYPSPPSEFGELPPEVATAARQSTVAGNWILGEQLGIGGQGVARLARRNDPFPLVGVMKVLRARPAASASQRAKALARFRREIEVTCAFEHPFILKVLDAEPDGDEPWIVTEYMPFGSLQQHLSVFRGDIWRSLRLARDVAVALECLHVARLVHRDVKPSNILLRGIDHPVLGDFGIVHDADEPNLTSTDEKVAPKWYGPPEAEDGRLDEPPPSFDVYSLGKVIYTMLSGGSRFQRENFRAPSADLTKLLGRPDVEPVNSLLDRMVTLNPEERFQSAREAVDGIDRVLSELFGRSRSGGRCPACGEAVLEDRGQLTVDTGGIKAHGLPINIHARVCPKCGSVDLVDHTIARVHGRR